MSPRAASRLEHLGFERAYDYAAGKSDWTAAGLPREGRSAGALYAGDVAREVPACHVKKPANEALEAVKPGEGAFCVAVDDDNVVLGVLPRDGGRELVADATVEDEMLPGPTTTRANEPVEPLVERMKKGDVDGILVTDASGHLLGYVVREDAEERLKG